MKPYSCAVVEDNSEYYSGVTQVIRTLNLNLSISINTASCVYTFDEYITELKRYLPDILLLDQKLDWRNNKSGTAGDIINILPDIYLGRRKPVLILNSKLLFNEVVMRYNTLRLSNPFYIPEINLFLTTTASILENAPISGSKSLLQLTFEKAFEYLEKNTIELPAISETISLRFDDITFYYRNNKQLPLNKIDLSVERFVCLIYDSPQRKGCLLYFDIDGILQVCDARSTVSFANLKGFLMNMHPSIKDSRRKILFNRTFFPNKYLISELTSIVQHSVTTSEYLNEDELYSVAKRWGII